VRTKVLAIVFWDGNGILLTVLLQKGRTLHGKYFLHKIIRKIYQKNQEKETKLLGKRKFLFFTITRTTNFYGGKVQAWIHQTLPAAVQPKSC
jgi:hypothetical protein